MITFKTFAKVEHMVSYRKRPLVVRATQMREDFRVDSLEGNYKQGKAGDYLVRGIDGELYICDRDIFERSYDQMQEDDYGSPKF